MSRLTTLAHSCTRRSCLRHQVAKRWQAHKSARSDCLSKLRKCALTTPTETSSPIFYHRSLLSKDTPSRATRASYRTINAPSCSRRVRVPSGCSRPGGGPRDQSFHANTSRGGLGELCQQYHKRRPGLMPGDSNLPAVSVRPVSRLSVKHHTFWNRKRVTLARDSQTCERFSRAAERGGDPSSSM